MSTLQTEAFMLLRQHRHAISDGRSYKQTGFTDF